MKDGLSGNSQTVMIATISPADVQYHHTVNTLKYADRAKEIKTHVQVKFSVLGISHSDLNFRLGGGDSKLFFFQLIKLLLFWYKCSFFSPFHAV